MPGRPPPLPGRTRVLARRRRHAPPAAAAATAAPAPRRRHPPRPEVPRGAAAAAGEEDEGQTEEEEGAHVGRGRAPGEAGRRGGSVGAWGVGWPSPLYGEGEGRSPAHWRRGRGRHFFRNGTPPPPLGVGWGRGPSLVGCGAFLCSSPHPLNSCGGASWEAGSSPSGRRGPNLPSPTIWQRLGVWGSFVYALGGVRFPGRVGSSSLASWWAMGWCV